MATRPALSWCDIAVGMAALPAVDAGALGTLLSEWPGLLEQARRDGHDVESDPYLTTDPEDLLRRFLIATDGNVADAAKRLRAMLVWRREWGILDCHRPGAARQLFSDESNPGSEMYFAQSGHEDRDGRPYVIGRMHYANASNMHPWRHLRAGVFVIERIAVEVMRGKFGYASYILDIGEVPIQGTVSGTGCSGRKFKETDNPYYKRGAAREAPQHLIDKFGELTSGLYITKAAIAIANSHYPELMTRVIVLRSNWLFGAAFRIFSMWMHKRSRDKFMFVQGGWGTPPMEALKQWYSQEELPEEFGGAGWRLDGDGFIRSAIGAYDAEPFDASGGRRGPLPRYAGWDEDARRLAAEDSRCRAQERAALSPGPRELAGASGDGTPDTARRPRDDDGDGDNDDDVDGAEGAGGGGLAAAASGGAARDPESPRKGHREFCCWAPCLSWRQPPPLPRREGASRKPRPPPLLARARDEDERRHTGRHAWKASNPGRGGGAKSDALAEFLPTALWLVGIFALFFMVLVRALVVRTTTPFV